MANVFKFFGFFLLALFLSSILFIPSIQARPFSVLRGTSCFGEIYEFSDNFCLGAMKQSGPSSGGKGHRSIDVQSLGGKKDSGPSPGQGHSFITGDHQ
ncbi:hypothetical protein IFM89_032144 [Coptis chinensis]|uniref:Glycine-rich protein n=1 Tax=Coptis chinensis TaxID=261450 RepID=A0A835IYU7_9MAGN|nr:hypothetical protein IFM89_032144 [Coptis chinensis]